MTFLRYIARYVAPPALLLLVAGAAIAGLAPVPLPEPDEVYPTPPNWKGQIVLHVGDSHAANPGYTSFLRRKIVQSGGRYNLSHWIGSRSQTWLQSGRLRKNLEEKLPSIVIVNLGTNAIQFAKPSKYASWIKGMTNKIGRRKCFWISPPGIIEDHRGFIDMIDKTLDTCRFFDSRTLGFRRHPSGAYHLNKKQGERWAAAVWDWMNYRTDESTSESADKSTKKSTNKSTNKSNAL